MAVSAVPESTAPLLRLVIDARLINVLWTRNIQYISIKSLRLIPGPKLLFWTVDSQILLTSMRLWGCGRPWKQPRIMILRLLLSVDENSYGKIATHVVVGCDGYSCSSFCDKAMLAVCMESHIMCFAASLFGDATSHGRLALLIEAFIRYISGHWASTAEDTSTT